MKILVDMNLSPRWADYLTERGIYTLHWSSAGLHDASDTEIMSYAKTHNFSVLTCDLDFGYILAITGSTKPSVIQVRAGELGPDRIGKTVLNAIKLLTADIENGALVTIDPRKTRVTVLPL